MSDVLKWALEYEELVIDIVRKLLPNAQIKSEVFRKGGELVEADAVISFGPEKYFLEVKISSSNSAHDFYLRNTIRQMKRFSHISGISHGILIIGSRVSDNGRATSAAIGQNLLVLDVADLWAMARSVNRQDELRELLVKIAPFSELDLNANSSFIEKLSAFGLIPVISEIEGDVEEQQRITKAKVLKSQLEEIDCGRPDATKYEEFVDDVLRTIFSEHLTNWTPQARSDTGMSRNDLVARVNSDHDFWKVIRSHFNSLYIVFEFKNYCGKVDQSQIFTTERYLYRSALRNAAFIFSRKGLDSNGNKAARGALREHGKLIIGFDDNDIIELIDFWAAGNDPMIIFSIKLDNMLVSIER